MSKKGVWIISRLSQKFERVSKKKKSGDRRGQQCVYRDEEYFMRLLSQCSVAVRFKIIYIQYAGKARERKRGENKACIKRSVQTESS